MEPHYIKLHRTGEVKFLQKFTITLQLKLRLTFFKLKEIKGCLEEQQRCGTWTSDSKAQYKTYQKLW